MSKEANNLLHLLKDVTLFFLMVFGVCGTMFKFLKPGGWLKGWMHEIWQFNPSIILTGAVLAIIIFLVIKGWLDSLSSKTILGDLILYAWVAAGLYFAVKLALTGDF